jgi:hypothetical protein
MTQQSKFTRRKTIRKLKETKSTILSTLFAINTLKLKLQSLALADAISFLTGNLLRGLLHFTVPSTRSSDVNDIFPGVK